jgi:hypothetical protein
LLAVVVGVVGDVLTIFHLGVFWLDMMVENKKGEKERMKESGRREREWTRNKAPIP